MRVLTVRQPWAWAIIHGGKDVENRTQNLAGDYRGPVAIHAGLAGFEQHNRASEAHKAACGTSTPSRIEFGAIIGVVNLDDVHHAAECVDLRTTWASAIPGDDSCEQEVVLCSGWAEEGEVYHLGFKEPRPLVEPIPFKGGLGLRRLDEDVERQVLAGVRS
jgi:hypothetical protein